MSPVKATYTHKVRVLHCQSRQVRPYLVLLDLVRCLQSLVVDKILCFDLRLRIQADERASNLEFG